MTVGELSNAEKTWEGETGMAFPTNTILQRFYITSILKVGPNFYSFIYEEPSFEGVKKQNLPFVRVLWKRTRLLRSVLPLLTKNYSRNLLT